MTYFIVSIIFLLIGAYLHHLIYKKEHDAALQRMETATDKHNHYAERWLIESQRAFGEGVDNRTGYKPKSDVQPNN
jgi:hypothetical protein